MNTDRKIYRLKKAMAATDEPLERKELKRRIGDRAAALARAEFRRKSADLRRAMAGAY